MLDVGWNEMVRSAVGDDVLSITSVTDCLGVVSAGVVMSFGTPATNCRPVKLVISDIAPLTASSRAGP